jgi:hypothetical protein
MEAAKKDENELKRIQRRRTGANGGRGMATKNIVIGCDGTGNEVSANISNV